jgi:DNA-binding MltR family transcriptional regulator
MTSIEDLLPYFHEVADFRFSLDQETDRGCALMAAAFLDAELEKLLGRHFVADDTVRKELLSQNGPLGAFSSRIDLAYALGLIGKQARRDLHLIRKIRNDFAHVAKSLQFSDQPIAQRCEEFYHDEMVGVGASPRARFTRTVLAVLAPIHVKLQTLKPPEARDDVVFDGKLKAMFDLLVEKVLGDGEKPAK